jgi:hypothetical protein
MIPNNPIMQDIIKSLKQSEYQEEILTICLRIAVSIMLNTKDEFYRDFIRHQYVKAIKDSDLNANIKDMFEDIINRNYFNLVMYVTKLDIDPIVKQNILQELKDLYGSLEN